MNIVLLFDSFHPQYDGIYGDYIKHQILRSEILQKSNRHLKISIGDILLPYEKNEDVIQKIYPTLFQWHPYSELKESKLKVAYYKHVIYTWVIQNVTDVIANELHELLKNDDAYLGFHQVDFSYLGHLAFYRNDMIPIYRIIGYDCHILCRMGENEEMDISEFKELNEYFRTILLEDYGAKKTFFDKYNSETHFKQISELEKIIAPFLQGKEYEASNLTLLIEECNPYLFNSFGAAIRALKRSINDEDNAQVGLSIRRTLEFLADTLFPAQETLFNGRSVKQDAYKNRIWAYFESELNDPSEVKKIGKELDRLVLEANTILHSHCEKDKVTMCLIDTIKFATITLNITSIEKKDPYFPYEKEIYKMLSQLSKDE